MEKLEGIRWIGIVLVITGAVLFSIPAICLFNGFGVVGFIVRNCVASHELFFVLGPLLLASVNILVFLVNLTKGEIGNNDRN
jgi:hypothetical protein